MRVTKALGNWTRSTAPRSRDESSRLAPSSGRWRTARTTPRVSASNTRVISEIPPHLMCTKVPRSAVCACSTDAYQVVLAASVVVYNQALRSWSGNMIIYSYLMRYTATVVGRRGCCAESSQSQSFATISTPAATGSYHMCSVSCGRPPPVLSASHDTARCLVLVSCVTKTVTFFFFYGGVPTWRDQHTDISSS